MNLNTILERHAVDVRQAFAEYREASVRRHDTSTQEYHCDSNVPNRSSVQNGGASTTGIQDLDVEERALSRNTLQGNGIEYVDHELLTNRFHVTHNGGCAVLFNKTLSSLMSWSNPSTFTISGAYCLIMRWKETQAWFYRACYHVPLFVDNLPAAKKLSQFCRCTSVTFTPRAWHRKDAYPYDSCSDA